MRPAAAGRAEVSRFFSSKLSQRSMVIVRPFSVAAAIWSAFHSSQRYAAVTTSALRESDRSNGRQAMKRSILGCFSSAFLRDPVSDFSAFATSL